MVRNEFGVLQDEAVTKYVTLVGTVLAQASTRPDLKWEFIVLDTDGVNAFAAPGGLVHITRGALGSDQERGGAGRRPRARTRAHHQEAHDQRDQEEQELQDWRRDGARQQCLLRRAGQRCLRQHRREGLRSRRRGRRGSGGRSAGEQGRIRAERPGDTFLENWRSATRTRQRATGCSHRTPRPRDRIEKIGRQVKSEKLAAAAMVEPRYASHITFDAKPVSRSRDGHRRNAQVSPADAKGKEGREAARGEEEERLRPRQPGALVRQAG